MQLTPNLSSSEIHYLEYNRRDALSDKAIINAHFELFDGPVKWINSDGEECRVEAISSSSQSDTRQAIGAALSTQLGDEVLHTCMKNWLAHRIAANSNAQLLVVCSHIPAANRALEQLRFHRINCDIATTENTKSAKESIKLFRTSSLDALVTVGMAYEGLNAPRITHLACLTRIRSRPYIEQVIGRATRVDHDAGPADQQIAYIFAPDDPLMHEVIQKIREDQNIVAEIPDDADEDKNGGSSEKASGEIIPIGSAVLRNRALELDSGDSMTYDETAVVHTLMEKLNIRGMSPLQVRDFYNALQRNGIDLDDLASSPSTTTDPVITPAEMQKSLRSSIEDHVRRFEFRQQVEFGTVNRALKNHFGKSRSEMNVDELASVWSFVQEYFPLE